jgi:hypothetical protein
VGSDRRCQPPTATPEDGSTAPSNLQNQELWQPVVHKIDLVLV